MNFGGAVIFTSMILLGGFIAGDGSPLMGWLIAMPGVLAIYASTKEKP